jgi:hypothetical protein
MTHLRRRVLVCAPDVSGKGFWGRRSLQHVRSLAGSGWDVEVASGERHLGAPEVAVVLAVGWVAAAAAAVALPGVPQVVDAAEVQFPVTARRALAGAGPARALDAGYADLVDQELSAYAAAAALVAASRFEADLLDDFLGRPGWAGVVLPVAEAAHRPGPERSDRAGDPGPERSGLLFVADPGDPVDADAVAWLEGRLVPLLPPDVRAGDALVVAGSVAPFTTARVVLVPPLLGARGHDLAARGLAAGAHVVAPGRVAEGFPPPCQAGIHGAESLHEFATAVAAALCAGPLPETVTASLLARHSPAGGRAPLLAALERATVPGSPS